MLKKILEKSVLKNISIEEHEKQVKELGQVLSIIEEKIMELPYEEPLALTYSEELKKKKLFYDLMVYSLKVRKGEISKDDPSIVELIKKQKEM